MNKYLLLVFLFLNSLLWSQNTSYWQQHVDYTMDIDMDVNQLSI